MDLSLSEHQEMLKGTVASFMEQECPKQVLLELEHSETGAPPALWSKITDLGLVGMLIPQQYGGGGSSFTDAAVVFQELGKGPLPGPYFSSGVLGALILLEAGTEAQKRESLPVVAKGDQVLTVAIMEPQQRWGPAAVHIRATLRNGSMTLNGAKLFVHDALAATHLICAVRTQESQDPAQGISLVVVDKKLPACPSAICQASWGGWQK